jgi:hypothetical protein
VAPYGIARQTEDKLIAAFGKKQRFTRLLRDLMKQRARAVFDQGRGYQIAGSGGYAAGNDDQIDAFNANAERPDGN